MRNTNFKINSVSSCYTATDLIQHQGTQTVEQGAAHIVKFAIAGNDTDSGKFLGRKNTLVKTVQ